MVTKLGPLCKVKLLKNDGDKLVVRSPEKAGVGGSTPSLATMFSIVRSGDIGKRTFRRHRLHFWPEGVLQGLQGFFLQINIAEIVIHKTNQPDAMVDFFDADGLAGEGHAEVDLLVVQAKASAAGDHDRAVVKWVMRFW